MAPPGLGAPPLNHPFALPVAVAATGVLGAAAAATAHGDGAGER